MSKHLVCDTCGADVPPEGLYSFPPEGWYTLTLRCNTTTPDRERHFCCPVCVIAGVKADIKIASDQELHAQTPLYEPKYSTYIADPRD